MVILAAVDEKRNPDRVIETAHELALAFDDELQVLHVIPEKNAEEHFNSLRKVKEFRDASFSIEIERAEKIAETLVDSALENPDRSNISPIGRTGDPADEIIATADSVNPRYVVIGSRKRSPTGKALFGSVSQSVILNSDWPTVTVKTDD
jgi:nucleotide-binding universal stress UspA family protein